MGMMSIRILFLVCVSGLFAGGAFCQPYPVVSPGPHGNYILCGSAIPLDFSYRIERNEAGKAGDWQLLATTAFKADSALFFGRLAEATSLNRVFAVSSPEIAAQLWQLVQKARVIDSLYSYASFPVCLQAVGVAWYDTTAVAGVEYQYRVTPTRPALGAEGGVSDAVSYPMETEEDYALKTVYAEPFENQIAIRLYSSANPQPSAIKLYRSPYLQGAFEEVYTQTGMVSDGGRTYHIASDTTFTPNRVYQYFAVPYDVYGNAGKPSDTIRIASQVDAGLPAIQQLAAEGDTVERAMRISWTIPATPYLQQVRIYRSHDYDSPDFVYIGSAEPGDSVFYDRDVATAHTYYYSIVLHGPKGASAPSVRVPGLLPVDPQQQVSPPLELEGAMLDSGLVRLQWLVPPDEVTGFYVYRAMGDSSEMQQVSGLIRASRATMAYVDTVPQLHSAEWHYTVKSVNKAFNLSEASDTVRVLSLAAAAETTAPLGVRVVYNGEVPVVYWKVPHLLESGYTGFHVYRAPADHGTGDTTAAEQLNVQEMHYADNMLEDTTFQRGVHYRYWITAVRADGSVQPSAPAEFFLAKGRLYSPGNLTARHSRASVVLSWDATQQADVKAYRIYRSLRGSEGEAELLETLSPQIARFEDSGVKRGDYYYYTVVCVDGTDQESPMEDWVGIGVD